MCSLSLFIPVFLLLLASCTSAPYSIPGPSPTVSRDETIATAYAYTQVKWNPEARHTKHGSDSSGILVHTPDSSLDQHGFANGWWKPGMEMHGVPYQWGGFDTPHQFLIHIEQGRFAGDISTAAKRRLSDSGTSPDACGIDCSGFISRCWRLDRPYSTRQLPTISTPLKTWFHLKPGDILLNDRHVLLFKDWASGGKSILCYEAGPFPVWRVNAANISVEKLEREGYQPWRYRNITD